MKFSIITLTFNSEKTIRDTLNSVMSQNYQNFEHIIIDGGSKDSTIKILNKYKSRNVKFYIKKNFNIYKSLNFAINKSKGEYILILHSDDIFNSNDILKKINLYTLRYKSFDIFLGNVAYFKNNNYEKITRLYSAQNFKPWKMRYGLMPPHPSSVIRKSIYLKYGLYNDHFSIAADFDFFLRCFFINKLKFKIINKTFVRMRAGGISGKNIFSNIKSTIEIYKSFNLNKINNYYFNILLRLPAKFHQLFFINQKKNNEYFRLFKILFEKEYYYKKSFKIIKDIKKFDLNKNFILSGANLAFLGYYSNNEVNLGKNIFHWPDGIWIKNHIKITKTPGKKLLEDLKLNKSFKSIVVFGNLSENSKKYLKNKFKVKIVHHNLPYGNIDNIIKENHKVNKSSLVLITLPTPKQEKYAFHLAKKNNFFKIICIGASVAIASGDEKPVPKALRNMEFLWRLRNDFFRRSKRLIETLFYYLKGKFFTKKFDEIRFLKID